MISWYASPRSLQTGSVGRWVPTGWVRGRSGLEGVGWSVECDSKFSPHCARQWVGRSVGPWHAKTIHSQSLYVALNNFPLKDWTLLGNWGVFNNAPRALDAIHGQFGRATSGSGIGRVCGGGRSVGRIRLKIFAALRAAVGRSVDRTRVGICQNQSIGSVGR